ncbi:hypothetical protein sS8_4894 [Methylocaldum marinum]|uniref:Uncharacterized protein n=1 Tax=Methylocaldum marinum TaxID=1432792 RepID=A0A250KYX2_9GAMM|nr:hypothetical protein [Methylocaldum marinum]BBA36817.1 hypothetical protein sS8_4894 [Methylocaldum marinum]
MFIRSYPTLLARLETARERLLQLRAGVRTIEALKGPEAVAHYLVVNPYATRLTFECPPGVAPWFLSGDEGEALRVRLAPWAEKARARVRKTVRRRQSGADRCGADLSALSSRENSELALWLARTAGTATVVNLIARRKGLWRERLAPFVDWLTADELWALEVRRKRLHGERLDLFEAALLLGVSADEVLREIESGRLPVLGRRLVQGADEVWPWVLDRVVFMSGCSGEGEESIWAFGRPI